MRGRVDPLFYDPIFYWTHNCSTQNKSIKLDKYNSEFPETNLAVRFQGLKVERHNAGGGGQGGQGRWEEQGQGGLAAEARHRQHRQGASGTAGWLRHGARC